MGGFFQLGMFNPREKLEVSPGFQQGSGKNLFFPVGSSPDFWEKESGILGEGKIETLKLAELFGNLQSHLDGKEPENSLKIPHSSRFSFSWSSSQGIFSHPNPSIFPSGIHSRDEEFYFFGPFLKKNWIFPGLFHRNLCPGAPLGKTLKDFPGILWD